MLADMGMKVEAARQLTYVAASKSQRSDADLTYFGAAAKCFASDAAMAITTDRGPTARWVRLYEGLPGRADDARCQDHSDLRGYESGPAHRDGSSAARKHELTIGRSGRNRIGHEGYILALVIAAWIQFVRPRITGSRAEWIITAIAALAFIALTIYLLAGHGVASRYQDVGRGAPWPPRCSSRTCSSGDRCPGWFAAVAALVFVAVTIVTNKSAETHRHGRDVRDDHSRNHRLRRHRPRILDRPRGRGRSADGVGMPCSSSHR